MELQFLVATMHRSDYDFLNVMNVTGNVVVINQCSHYGCEKVVTDRYTATIYSTPERGLARSRNEALKHVTGDIILTADDDIVYKPGAAATILETFHQHPEADIIAFNRNIEKSDGRTAKHISQSWKKSPKNKYYSSVTLAFKFDSLKKVGLLFDEDFGTGAMYHAGEESLLLRKARKAKLSVFECDKTILTQPYGESTWFNGFNEQYYYDKGAWTKAAYPKTCNIVKYYYVLTSLRRDSISIYDIIKYLNYGMDGYKKHLSFNDYIKGLDK